MVSGFFLGGIADSIQNQQAIALKAKQLGIQQQYANQEQQRFQQAQFMKLRADAYEHLQTTITSLKNAHPDWTDQQILANGAVAPQIAQLSGFDKNLGLDPNSAQFSAAGMAAGRSQIETEGALAQAKESPQHRQLVESEIAKNNATAGLPVAGVPGNPDLDRATQLGGRPPSKIAVPPSKGAGDTFNQRFAQEGQQEAPRVLNWADARSQVAQKYSPEVATKAELWLKGNAGVVSGLRGSGAGKNNERKQIQDAAMDLARLTGMTADQINQNFVNFKGRTAAATAGGRTAGQREAALGVILAAADSSIDAAIAASRDVPRTDFVPLNRAQQIGQAAVSNEKLKIFQQKNLNLAEQWAKSFNPGGVMRVEDRNLALDILNTAVGNKTYEAAAHAIRDSIGLEKSAAKRFLEERGFAGSGAASDDDSGSEPGKGGVKVHGFTFTPTSQ